MKGFIQKLFIGLVFVGFASSSAFALPTLPLPAGSFGHGNFNNNTLDQIQLALIKGQINTLCEASAPSNADLESDTCKAAVKACVDEYIAICGVEAPPCDGFNQTVPGIDSRTQVSLRCNPDFVAPGTAPSNPDTGVTPPPPATPTDTAATPTNDANNTGNMGNGNSPSGSGCSLNALQGSAPMTGSGILSTLMMIPFALRLRKKK